VHGFLILTIFVELRFVSFVIRLSCTSSRFKYTKKMGAKKVLNLVANGIIDFGADPTARHAAVILLQAIANGSSVDRELAGQ
jgi:hypothetical protein